MVESIAHTLHTLTTAALLTIATTDMEALQASAQAAARGWDLHQLGEAHAAQLAVLLGTAKSFQSRGLRNLLRGPLTLPNNYRQGKSQWHRRKHSEKPRY